MRLSGFDIVIVLFVWICSFCNHSEESKVNQVVHEVQTSVESTSAFISYDFIDSFFELDEDEKCSINTLKQPFKKLIRSKEFLNFSFFQSSNHCLRSFALFETDTSPPIMLSFIA
jgi:hypothetical protein